MRELIGEGLPEVADIELGEAVPLAEVRLQSPVELHKVVCAGVNFPTHREEAEIEEARPAYPVIFNRFADSHVGHGADLLKPAASTMFDYEGELAIVIGAPAWQVDVGDAMKYVFGYSCYNDGSARDWQMHTHQWVPGKNFYRSGSIGPWLVTADEVGNIGDAWLTTRVNGEQRQRAQIKDMVHSIPELIAYVSAFTPLNPGDVIAAGTPGGVGMFMEPQAFLRPGQQVEVEIDNVGILRNRVCEASETQPA
ncbi:fumarylacetoacetate hydrolase family protein [Prauserella aidingensis]|uniref:fumarylacetoacetate hydrolase family protein n=1 Tax=Prauserella aidingensis TaxID=387890 RepID=UPI0020A509EE|nr:fumarylacetoacetate hydrolase family protein [Prauserella aidingensis]